MRGIPGGYRGWTSVCGVKYNLVYCPVWSYKSISGLCDTAVKMLSGLRDHGKQMITQLPQTVLCSWWEGAFAPRLGSCWDLRGARWFAPSYLRCCGGGLGETRGVRGLRKEGGECSCDLSLPCFLPDSCLGMVSAPTTRWSSLNNSSLFFAFTIVLFHEGGLLTL